MEYNKFIDHTLLKADATSEEIEKLCNEARKYNFMSVCVNPSYIPLCKKLLKGSEVKICTVVGFPLGMMSTSSKGFETKQALLEGCDEVDMVINIGRLKEGNYNYVKNEIATLKGICKEKVLKVIIETCLLTDSEKITACKLAREAGADFVKTSTGFSKGGATAEDVALMRKTVGPVMGVKASGGVSSFEDMEKMINNGATRIGTSHGVDIMEEVKA